MLDVLFVFTGLVFFVVAGLYVYGCDWLIRDNKAAERGERVETMGEKLAGEG